MNERLLKGGVTRLIVYRRDTGESLDIPSIIFPSDSGGGLLSVEPEFVPTAAGKERKVSQRHRLLALMIDGRIQDVLRTWQAARAPIEAICLGFDQGAHRIWSEPVIPKVVINDGEFGEFAGDVLELFSARFDALITESDNLLALDPWADLNGDGIADGWNMSSGTLSPQFLNASETGMQFMAAGRGVRALWRDFILPAPGLRGRFGAEIRGGWDGAAGLLTDPQTDDSVKIILQAITASAMGVPYSPTEIALGYAPLATETIELVNAGVYGAWLTLPERTFAVRMIVQADGRDSEDLPAITISRPTLTTRDVSSVGLITGGFLLMAQDADSISVTPIGNAWVEETQVTRSFMGNTYPLEILQLGPPDLLARIAEPHPTDPYILRLQVIPPV